MQLKGVFLFVESVIPAAAVDGANCCSISAVFRRYCLRSIRRSYVLYQLLNP